MPGTIWEYLQSLVRIPRGKLRRIVEWPPDIFGVVGSILQHRGGYCAAVCEMRVQSAKLHDPQLLEKWGKQWRVAVENKSNPPKPVVSRWVRFLSMLDVDLDEALGNDTFKGLLLDLFGTADSACENISAPDFDEFGGLFQRAFIALHDFKTLSPSLRADRVRVLPKVHTSQVGMTIRSLSHHLALCPTTEVACTWLPLPTEMALNRKDPRVNLLLIPYPYDLDARVFQPSNQQLCGRSPLPGEFGFFRCVPPSADAWIADELPVLLKKARQEEGDIHGVVLPEGSLSSEAAYDKVRDAVTAVLPDAFVLAGVVSDDAAENGQHRLLKNRLFYDMPLVPVSGSGEKRISARVEQSKHHRWKLDRGQMERYGITTLDHGRYWWEHIDISQRELYVFAARSTFNFCFLICEDLARQEPVAPLVRAVGPDLVIALLQDGPQFAERWPGRYATILTEDPGCSVLTLSSLGMVRMSQPNGGTRARAARRDSCVGLWRDKKNSRELILRPRSRALLLRLRSERQTEYSADGRQDTNASSLVLQESLQI